MVSERETYKLKKKEKKKLNLQNKGKKNKEFLRLFLMMKKIILKMKMKV